MKHVTREKPKPAISKEFMNALFALYGHKGDGSRHIFNKLRRKTYELGLYL